MKMRSDEVYAARAEILKAMAHPSRLKILDMLSEGERCVCDLQEGVGSDMSTVSRHLAVMRAAGIVSTRREGSNIFYRLRVPCILNFFGCVQAVMAERAKERTRVVKDFS
jgi:ArsR family transcriptional regulator